MTDDAAAPHWTNAWIFNDRIEVPGGTLNREALR
jgi:hypothetical protein